MSNFWSGEDFVAGTNQHPLICDATTTSHGNEEPFSSYPMISNVWSINNPNDQLTPQPVVEGEMETGDEGQEEPLPQEPLRLKVQLPSRASFLANGVHHLELVLLYGHLEEHVLMIDIHGPMMELPIQPPSEPEIPIISDNSATVDSFPFSSPNHGVVEKMVENPPLPPSHPPRKKITARRRGQKQSPTCQICHKKLANKQSAARHSFVHLSQEEKEVVKQGWKNKCYFCSKRYQTPFLLDRHLAVHTKEKAHPCSKCRKQFTDKSSLTKHLHLHDPATRRPFHCHECDKAFTQNSHLTTHVNTVHRRLKVFQCPQCDQKFATKGDMTRHLSSVHLGIRYPCRRPHCGKSFTQIGQLHRHEKQPH